MASPVWAMMAFFVVLKMLFPLAQICKATDDKVSTKDGDKVSIKDGDKVSTKDGDKVSTSGGNSSSWRSILTDDQQQFMNLGFDGQQWTRPTFVDNFGTAEWTECASPIDQFQWQQQNIGSSGSTEQQQIQIQQQNFDQLGDQLNLGDQKHFDQLNLGDQHHFDRLASQWNFGNLSDQRHFAHLNGRLNLLDVQQHNTVYQDKMGIHPTQFTELTDSRNPPIRMIPTPTVTASVQEAGPSHTVPMGPPLFSPRQSLPTDHHQHQQKFITFNQSATVHPMTAEDPNNFTVFTPEITVPRRKHTVTPKRPMEKGKNIERQRQKVSKKDNENKQKQQQQQKMNTKTNETNLSSQKNAKAKIINYLCNVFGQILWTLDGNEQSLFVVPQLLALFREGATKNDAKIGEQFEELAKTLRQMDTGKVWERFMQEKVAELIKSSEKMMEVIRRIQTEIKILFDSKFKNEANNDQLIRLGIIQQNIEFPEENIQNRVKLLYFLLRMFRKMAGLIGAPYQSIDEEQQNTKKTKRTEREALLILISMTRKATMTYFEFFLDINAFGQRKMMLHAVASVDAFDLISESVELAHFGFTQSLGPLLIGQNIFPLQFACVLVLLEDILAKNIGCLLMINGQKLANRGDDLMKQIKKSAKNETERVSYTFLRLFNETIRQNDEKGGQNDDKLIQNAKIYRAIYEAIGKYMTENGKNELTAKIINKNSALKSVWDKMHNLLAKSVGQLDNLAKEWSEFMHRESGEGVEEVQKQTKQVIGRWFASVFVQNHCQNFGAEGTKNE